MDFTARLPAEWCEQSGVMLTWPHAETDWASQLPQVEACYLQIAREIAARERLLLICPDPIQCRLLKQKLLALDCPADHLLFAALPSNDTWSRDYAPLTVIDKRGASLRDFRFNGWGGRYPAELDDGVSAGLAGLGYFGRTPFHSVDLVLEGGAIETDGAGSLLATRRSLLGDNRNPHKSTAQIEAVLQRELGFDRFLWLDRGRLSGDDTDGHIDTLARFCDPQTIVYSTVLPGDQDAEELEAMRRQLSSFKTRQGQRYRLIPLPGIRPQYGQTGQRLPLSYSNFLLINGALLLPVYADPSDRVAAERLQSCFPDRQILAIDCRPLVRQNGSLHCCTMQFPRELELRPAPWPL